MRRLLLLLLTAVPATYLLPAALRGADADVEEVAFSRDGGLIAQDVPLDVAAPATPGAVVRFTTDDSVPTSWSPVWPGTMTVSETTIVRAAVFAEGGTRGPVASRQFLRLDGSLTSWRGSGAPFSSSLPVIVADTFGADIGATREDQFAYVVVTDTGVSGRAVLGATPDHEGRAAMHLRGNSSARFDQKPYAWETHDGADEDADVSVLGMPEESDWVLAAPWSDKSLMRNALAYGLMRELRGDGSAMRTRFVELFVHDEAAGRVTASDYRGVYLLTEKVKRDKNRVNVAKLTASDTDPARITGGYILRVDKPSDDPMFITTARNVRVFVVEPSEPNEQQFAYARSYVEAFEAALASPSFADPATGYAAYIEPDTFLDNYWFVEALKQVDGFRSSTYYAKDRGGRLRALPIWDYDLSLGNASYLGGESPQGWYHERLGGSEFAWYDRLFEDPAFALAAWDRWWQLRAGVFSDAHVAGEITRMRDVLLEGRGEPVTNDTPDAVDTPAARHCRRWPILGKDVWPNPPGSAQRTTYQSEVGALLRFALKRLDWIDRQCAAGGSLLRPPRFSRPPGTVTAGARVAIARTRGRNVARGTIWFTTDGRDPRGPDGAPQGAAFTRPVTVTASLTLKARLFDGTSWGPLGEARYDVR